MADRRIRIVTLTVTEKGYASTRDAASSTRRPGHRRDLATPEEPRHRGGFIVEALARGASRHPPFTCCAATTCPRNGRTLLTRVLALRGASIRPRRLIA